MKLIIIILIISCLLIISGCYLFDTTQLFATALALIVLGVTGVATAPIIVDLT